MSASKRWLTAERLLILCSLPLTVSAAILIKGKNRSRISPSSTSLNSSNGIEIEVGAVEGELRYWRAKEAIRQGEARLNAQAAVRAALEARATALTGWAAVALLAVTGAGFTATDSLSRTGALTAGIVLFAAAIVGIHAARPRDWAMLGYDPSVITSDRLGSELELLESIALGLSPGIQANNWRLNSMGRMLRRTGGLLIAAPLVGAISYALAYKQALIIILLLEVVHRLFR